MIDGQISFWDKPKVIFIEDKTDLCEDFKVNTEWELFMEQKEHWVIFHSGIYYHPYKKSCEKVN